MVFIHIFYLKYRTRIYVMNPDELKSIRVRMIALYVNRKNRRVSYDAIYFDSFRVEHIAKKLKIHKK